MRGSRGLSGGFVAIIVFKYFKAVVFFLVGVAALRLWHASPFPSAREIAHFLRSSPENELVRWIAGVPHSEILGIGILSLFVAAVFAAEGSFLTARVWWSTYLTISLTALGIPLELFEILRHPASGLRRYVIFAVNVIILVYLWRRRNEFRGTWGRPGTVG
jgi:uncharacterized membrane protein (DUF2068 family)